jgi:hypothetical protein
MRTNRSQRLVLGFFIAVWIALVAILVFAPEIYSETLRPIGVAAPLAELGFFGCVTVFLALLALGVTRRWRWVFWLIVMAFLAGLLRLPASILELTGVLPAEGPTWYEFFQLAVGGVQFVIGVLLLRGYKRGGVWGRF